MSVSTKLVDVRKTLGQKYSILDLEIKRRVFLNGKTISPKAALSDIMRWLARAQDVTVDGGVAQAFFVKEGRWAASYPETTGYIIPTFFDYAQFAHDNKFTERAIRMADWELQIQFAEGGIQASTIDTPQPIPTVFNTGMVILGWLSAYKETSEHKYLDAAKRAADWLLRVQDEDGAWRRFGSTVTTQALNTYNARVAWALLEVHRAAEDLSYLRAAQKNLEWGLTQQLANGWLANNCILDSAQPYTHTIAYAMRGFIEGYTHLGDDRYLDLVRRMYQGLLPSIKKDGFLPGRFDQEWRPAAYYCCLTGNAQLAIIGFRLYELTGHECYFKPAENLLRFVLRTQDITTPDLNIRGAIAGSFPIYGKYHPYQYPNWAAKFTAEGIMKLLKIER